MAKKVKAAPDQVGEPVAVQGVRPSTDTNIVIQLLVGIVGTVIVYFAVQPLKGGKLNYLWGIICDRGPVQFAELIMAFMVMAFIFLKSRIVRNQTRVIGTGPVQTGIDLNDDEQLQNLRNNLEQRREFGWSIVLNRITRMIALWLGSKDISRVATWASSESERDTSASDSSYATVRVLIWAIPIMGFIGTVMGLGNAVSGFSEFLAGAAELSAIKDAIGNVTIGLGVAFDTTLLALVLSVLLMFPLASIQRREENLFVEVDNYLEDSLVSRFPSPEAQPIVIDNLDEAIEAGFRRYIPDPDRYDEVFTRSIEKAATSVEEKFINLAKSYEQSLNDLANLLANSASRVGEGLEGTMDGIIAKLRAQEEELMRTRKSVADDEIVKVKDIIEQLYNEANRSTEQFHLSIESMRKATADTSEKTLAVAERLSARMDEVREMAAGIKDLLKIEESLEQSLQGIASSDEFNKTLQDIREHLATTDAFCDRLSKPRVITLTEEVS